MDCKSCGDTNHKGSKFCKKCGSSLVFSCPECKKEINPDSKFCILCGALISLEEPDSTSQVEVSEPVTQHSTTLDVSEPKKSGWALFGKIMLGFLGIFVVLLIIGIIVGEEEPPNHVEELGTQKIARQNDIIAEDEDMDESQESATPTPTPTSTPYPTPEGFNYYEQGEQYLWQDENYVKAVESFTEYINLNPTDAKGYEKRGNSYQELRRYQEALKDYNKAIELNTKSSDIYGKRGHVYGDLGQYQNAINDYDKQIELDLSNPWPHHYKGMNYRRLGQYELAIQSWEQYIEFRLIESADWIESEQAANAYTNIGLAYIELSQYQKAIEHFDKALAINQNYSGAIKAKEKATESLK